MLEFIVNYTLVIYVLIIIAIGFFVGRKVKSAADFFIAGHNLNSGLLFTTLIAANLGAGSTVGVTALAYKYGVSAWWWIGSAGIGSLILAFIVGPRIWKISREHDLFTLSDYLEMRYNKFFSSLISFMMTFGTLALFSSQLLGIAWILDTVAGIPKFYGVLTGAIVTTLYFAAGGLLSSAFVNIVEVAVILAGFLISVPYLLYSTGGIENISARINNASYFDFGGMGLTAIIGYLIMLVPSFFVSPGLIGKIFGAKDVRAIKIGTALNGLVQLFFAAIPVFIGIVAFAYFPDLSNADLALPVIMKNMLPFYISSLALAAIFAAEVSTADTVLYMLAGALTNDIYKKFLNPNISDKNFLRASRVTSIICGVLGILLALKLESIISALTIFYSLMSVSLTAPLIFGLFTKKANSNGAILSAILGVALTLYITFFKNGVIDFGFIKLNATTCGIIFSFVIMFFAMLFTKSKD